MLARCTHCESTFVTSQFGRQRCPKCGVEVVVDDPRAEQAPPPEQPPTPAPAPEAEQTPWERRVELGFLPALGATISEVISRPGPFFRRIRYDTDDGALLYFALVGIVPYIFSRLFEFAISKPGQSAETIAELKKSGAFDQFPAAYEQLYEKIFHWMEILASPRWLPIEIILMILGLFASVGVVHAVLSLFGKAKGGWTGTFKATVYATTPFIFVLMPVCGGLIAGTWATGLQIYGIARAHRISVGWASVGVLTLHAVAITCCCGAFFLAFAALLQTAHGLPGQ